MGQVDRWYVFQRHLSFDDEDWHMYISVYRHWRLSKCKILGRKEDAWHGWYLLKMTIGSAYAQFMPYVYLQRTWHASHAGTHENSFARQTRYHEIGYYGRWYDQPGSWGKYQTTTRVYSCYSLDGLWLLAWSEPCTSPSSCTSWYLCQGLFLVDQACRSNWMGWSFEMSFRCLCHGGRISRAQGQGRGT